MSREAAVSLEVWEKAVTWTLLLNTQNKNGKQEAALVACPPIGAPRKLPVVRAAKDARSFVSHNSDLYVAAHDKATCGHDVSDGARSSQVHVARVELAD